MSKEEISNNLNENVWICRAGKNREFEKVYLEKGIIGFNFKTDLGTSKPYDFKETKRKMEKYYDGSQLSRNASIVFILSNRMSINDFVLLPMKSGMKKYYFGIITSDCIYDENDQFNYKRKIRWIMEIEKEIFSDKTKYSMGSLLPLFKVNITKEDYQKLLNIQNIPYIQERQYGDYNS